MRFSTLSVAVALGFTSAIAAQDVQVHVVTVGKDGKLVFSPDSVTANVGDMVQFQFMPVNHSVVQSSFDQPCHPISTTKSIFSGFMPVDKSATEVPTFTIVVNNTNPMWLYCSQGKHCQSGMVMVINESPAKNSTRTLTNYAAMAKGVAENLSPSSGENGGSLGNSAGGSSSTGTSSPAASTGYGSDSGVSTATGTATGAAVSPSSSITKTSGTKPLRAPEALSLTILLAGAVALFL